MISGQVYKAGHDSCSGARLRSGHLSGHLVFGPGQEQPQMFTTIDLSAFAGISLIPSIRPVTAVQLKMPHIRGARGVGYRDSNVGWSVGNCEFKA